MILSFDDPKEEQIVEARVVVEEGDSRLAFDRLVVRFVYRAPSRKVVLLPLVRPGEEEGTIAEVLKEALAGIPYVVQLYEGDLSSGLFIQAFRGERDALEQVKQTEDTAYALLVLVESTGVFPLELGGRTYKLYVAEGRADVRLVRIEDGALLYEKVLERNREAGTHGQGPTEDRAALDVVRGLVEDVRVFFREHGTELVEGLTGE